MFATGPGSPAAGMDAHPSEQYQKRVNTALTGVTLRPPTASERGYSSLILINSLVHFSDKKEAAKEDNIPILPTCDRTL